MGFMRHQFMWLPSFPPFLAIIYSNVGWIYEEKKFFSLLNTYKVYAQGICVLTNVEKFSRGILIINGEIVWGTICFFYYVWYNLRQLDDQVPLTLTLVAEVNDVSNSYLT